ncbi:uncharacterized protein LOC124380329 isoform X2 [Silurus meridionalis]|uniref:uncharacterized protein LOC124380329 isoform X2 n=1 Tax=Silurus meridionalis TaxID=175797 RepID=UPI001EEC5043|nr:uncharacterized protein LOC124380329 isoform X2 [Silurus meridionalis]
MYRDVSEEVPLHQAEAHIEQFPHSSVLSVTSLAWANRIELLKKSSPKSKALERLRAKIQQQRLETISSSPRIDKKSQEGVTRKVCKVSNKGEVIRMCVPVSQWKTKINPSSGKEHLNRALRGTAPCKQQHYTYISAWRDAQKLVKEALDSQSIRTTDSQEDNTKKHIEKITPNVYQNNAAVKTQAGSKPRPKEPNGSENICPPNQATNLAGSYGKSNSAWPWCVKGKENEGPAKQSTAHAQKAQEVREYMHHKVLERRRREQEMRRKAEFELERKRMSVQDIVKKQKEALHRTRKEQTQEAWKRKTDDKELFASRSKTLGMQLNVQYAILNTSSRPLQMELFSDARSKIDNPVHLADVKSSLMISAKALRVEALRKTIASLDTRVHNETVRLGISGHKESHTRPTLGKHEQDMDKIKKKKKNSEKCMSINKKEKKLDEHACPMMCALQSEPRMIECTSDQDDSCESTSKWSEMSGMYSQGQFQCHLSLAQSQQFIWEEELRARQFSALLRLREKALWERTQAELLWLEHCKKNAQESEEETEIKKKQEEVLSRLRHHEAEIHHWRSIYKCGRHQRRLLLYQHRDISDIKKSTTHFRQVLENQTMTETDSKLGDTALVAEGKSLITKPGIIPAARGEDKPLSFLLKQA